MARNSLRTSLLFLALFLLFPAAAFAASAKTSIGFSVPVSPAPGPRHGLPRKPATFSTKDWIGIDPRREEPRMVAAMLGGSAPILQAGPVAALTAAAAGADVVIIGATGHGFTVSFDGTARDRAAADLKGKRRGSLLSDRFPISAPHRVKEVRLRTDQRRRYSYLSAQPEAFAALQSGIVQVAALSYPLYPKAVKFGMRELVNFRDLGVEDINGTMITTRPSSLDSTTPHCASYARSPTAFTVLAPTKNSAKSPRQIRQAQ